MAIERLTLGDVGNGCCGAYSTVEPDPLGELVAVKDLQVVVNALHLALAICDNVPSQLHRVGEDGWQKRLGELVNNQPDGRHGYALIRDALESVTWSGNA